jgi:hypothetical protein
VCVCVCVCLGIIQYAVKMLQHVHDAENSVVHVAEAVRSI